MSRRILGLGGLVCTVCLAPVEVPAAAVFFFFSSFFFLAARVASFLAVSARMRARVVRGRRFRASTVGVLSSIISLLARSRNLLGTLLTLWLAVRLRMARGTCWKTRVALAALHLRMLVSRALISNSRVLRKRCRSSLPSSRAASDGWVRMLRASWNLTRLVERVVVVCPSWDRGFTAGASLRFRASVPLPGGRDGLASMWPAWRRGGALPMLVLKPRGCCGC